MADIRSMIDESFANASKLMASSAKSAAGILSGEDNGETSLKELPAKVVGQDGAVTWNLTHRQRWVISQAIEAHRMGFSDTSCMSDEEVLVAICATYAGIEP